MKALLRGMRLSGGAPKSAYQYLNILKQDGYEITVMIQECEQDLKELYENTFDRVIIKDNIIDLFTRRSFIRLYRLLRDEYRFLKTERPGLVFVMGDVATVFYGSFCRALGLPVILMVAGGDLSRSEPILDGCYVDRVICFSEENREVLLRHFDEEKIFAISNRIRPATIFSDVEQHYSRPSHNGEVKVLLTSRISEDKYDSIEKFISAAESVAEQGRKISLDIAGAGESLDRLKKRVAESSNPFLTIQVKGHLDKLTDEFSKAHIVVGKGRSVLEPMMMNRVGCVIGDDGKIELCTEENFDRLYKYNFSGRQLECDDPVRVLETVVDSVICKSFDAAQITQTAGLISRYYSAEHLEGKFRRVLEGIGKGTGKRRVGVFIPFLMVKFTVCRFRQKLFIKKCAALKNR